MLDKIDDYVGKLKKENEKLETRIAELERYVKELGDECKVHRNKERNLNTIKAEGIRGIKDNVKPFIQYKGCEPHYSEAAILEYADKLEKGNE